VLVLASRIERDFGERQTDVAAERSMPLMRSLEEVVDCEIGSATMIGRCQDFKVVRIIVSA
jgi:hypothetical protein